MKAKLKNAVYPLLFGAWGAFLLNDGCHSDRKVNELLLDDSALVQTYDSTYADDMEKLLSDIENAVEKVWEGKRKTDSSLEGGGRWHDVADDTYRSLLLLRLGEALYPGSDLSEKAEDIVDSLYIDAYLLYGDQKFVAFDREYQVLEKPWESKDGLLIYRSRDIGKEQWDPDQRIKITGQDWTLTKEGIVPLKREKYESVY